MPIAEPEAATGTGSAMITVSTAPPTGTTGYIYLTRISMQRYTFRKLLSMWWQVRMFNTHGTREAVQEW